MSSCFYFELWHGFNHLRRYSKIIWIIFMVLLKKNEWGNWRQNLNFWVNYSLSKTVWVMKGPSLFKCVIFLTTYILWSCVLFCFHLHVTENCLVLQEMYHLVWNAAFYLTEMFLLWWMLSSPLIMWLIYHSENTYFKCPFGLRIHAV